MSMSCAAKKCIGAHAGPTMVKDEPAAGEDDRTTVASSPALTATSIDSSEVSEQYKVPSCDLFTLPDAAASDSDAECEALAGAVRRWALAGSRYCPRGARPPGSAEERANRRGASSEGEEDEEDAMRLGLAVRRLVLQGARRG